MLLKLIVLLLTFISSLLELIANSPHPRFSTTSKHNDPSMCSQLLPSLLYFPFTAHPTGVYRRKVNWLVFLHEKGY